MTAVYPAHREATVVLRDGSTVAVRPIRTQDEAELGRLVRIALALETRSREDNVLRLRRRPTLVDVVPPAELEGAHQMGTELRGRLPTKPVFDPHADAEVPTDQAPAALTHYGSL